MIGQRYARALELAIDAHDGQVRKTTAIPYISHPLAVSALAMEHGGDEDQAIIGLLHDVLEDGGAIWADPILKRFGMRVLEGVRGCSDCVVLKGQVKPDWRTRKHAYLAHLETASRDVLLVSACDKLHNAGCIVRDQERIGDAVFERFRAGRDETLWYYDALARTFRRKLRFAHPGLTEDLLAMVARMKALLD